MMGAVSDLVTVLNRDSVFLSRGLEAYWEHTGGGCFAILIQFGEVFQHNGWEHTRYEIMVTDREDVFAEPDLRRDETLSGFNACLYVKGDNRWADYDPAYDEGNPVVVYRTRDDAGVSLCEISHDEDLPLAVKLPAEVESASRAIVAIVAMIADAEEQGRGGE